MAEPRQEQRFPIADTSTTIPKLEPGKHKRRRNWAPKAKTGCTTCRIRRIKCDEAKPVCSRCASTGRKCDGYTDTHSSPNSWHRSLSIEPQRAVMYPEGIQPNPQDLQAAHFFRMKTSTYVSTAFDQQLWNVELPRATLMHPALWYAANSFAAMYQRAAINEGVPSQQLKQSLYNYSLRQYNSSIKHLLNIPGLPKPSLADQEVILLTNVLFVAVCSLKDNLKEALVHAYNGLKLFHQWGFLKLVCKCWSSTQGDGLIAPRSLVSLFCRLDSQVRSLCDYSSQVAWQWQGVVENQIYTTPFTSVTEAYFEQELLLNGLMELMQAQEFVFTTVQQNPMPETRYKYQNLFQVWKAKFSNLQKSGLIGSNNVEGILILRIREIAVSIALQLDLSQIELGWDTFQPQFERLVELAQHLLDYKKSWSEGAGQRQSKLVFQLSAAVCEPLYLVAVSCRIHRIRQKAIALLREWPSKEGLWNPILAAGTAESVMAYEEYGGSAYSDYNRKTYNCECVLKAYVCQAHRVLDTHMNFLGEGSAQITLRTIDDVYYSRAGQINLIEW